ncbi:GNAT family N-acetyltransferase [Massilia sp. GCM10020059]|uniref:GNAT family N-acetyltransferase n=1 Tax=Massilia agrisoli TaxID=2892444 RepID=A0ABS8ISQ1_9BURK|nr:GNAT family N-acetyltransferase [Massilia agrisoli]MCC6070738.1 GNAT family N-acetyltransferase [Massilia agrisoli]
MHIRPCAAGEEIALRAIFKSSVHGLARRNYTAAQIQAWAPREESAELCEQWIRRIQVNQPWVAEVNGQLAAFADVQPSGYIDHFFVAAEFAGQGVGNALMRHLHEIARCAGIDTLFSHVSLTAQPFFRRHGFHVEKEQRVMIRGVELENAVMRKAMTAITGGSAGELP